MIKQHLLGLQITLAFFFSAGFHGIAVEITLSNEFRGRLICKLIYLYLFLTYY